MGKGLHFVHRMGKNGHRREHFSFLHNRTSLQGREPCGQLDIRGIYYSRKRKNGSAYVKSSFGIAPRSRTWGSGVTSTTSTW